VVEHHLVVLAPDAGRLVAAEGRVRRVVVVAVGPYAPGLDRAAHAEGARAVAGPHAGAKAVERVVGDLQRLGLVLERGHREHRAEDLLLEDAHVVRALQHGRLEVEAAFEAAVDVRPLATDQSIASGMSAASVSRTGLPFS
jgi:hypothetical protein